jgi:gamma-glutamylcyclotransferase (GGCT)/AIG2-like uncharacterized protein YtfP
MSKPDPDSDGSLFVYGSLLDEAHRTALLGRAVVANSARLNRYERRRSRYFYIVEHVGAETAGLVLSGLRTRDFVVLDRYEEVPRLYTRVTIEVMDSSGGTARRCWIYLPTPELLAGEA